MSVQGESLYWNDGNLVVGHHVNVDAVKRDVALKRELQGGAPKTNREGYQTLASIPIAVATHIRNRYGLDAMLFGKFSAADKQKFLGIIKSDFPELLL